MSAAAATPAAAAPVPVPVVRAAPPPPPAKPSPPAPNRPVRPPASSPSREQPVKPEAPQVVNAPAPAGPAPAALFMTPDDDVTWQCASSPAPVLAQAAVQSKAQPQTFDLSPPPSPLSAAQASALANEYSPDPRRFAVAEKSMDVTGADASDADLAAKATEPKIAATLSETAVAAEPTEQKVASRLKAALDTKGAKTAPPPPKPQNHPSPQKSTQEAGAKKPAVPKLKLSVPAMPVGSLPGSARSNQPPAFQPMPPPMSSSPASKLEEGPKADNAAVCGA